MAWQFVEESRVVRRFQQDWERTQRERVHTGSYQFQCTKNLSPKPPTGSWAIKGIGLDLQYNQVASVAWQRQVDNGQQSPGPSRYPGGGSSMWLAGMWAEGQYQLAKKWQWSFGLRGNFSHLSAQFNDSLFFPFPFEEAQQTQGAINGSTSLQWQNSFHRIGLNVATGFRSPNLDDLAKVFDSQPGLLVVPNPDLAPEYVYSTDLVYRLRRSGNQLALTGFASWVDGLLALAPGSLAGEDSIEFDGIPSQILQAQNQDYGYMVGFNVRYDVAFAPQLGFSAQFNFTYGSMLAGNLNQWVPMAHIPPVFGKMEVTWTKGLWELGSSLDVHFWKLAKDYSPFGEDNLRYASPLGMPAWWTWNIRGAYRLHAHLRLQVALDNVFDLRYRVFASGISAPGRNLVVAINGRF